MYRYAKEYFLQNGNLDIPTKFGCVDGFKLGAWIANHRDKSTARQSPVQLTEQRTATLSDGGSANRKRVLLTVN
ncbi:MAG: helicase associated domain-containing protein [Oscillospiraceae bacterium]|nr:helicase associated domain-containing protein [Oscillospiraceae bacterium]